MQQYHLTTNSLYVLFAVHLTTYVKSISLACRPIVHEQVQYPGWDERKCESMVCGEPYVIRYGTSQMAASSVEHWAMVLQGMSCTEPQTAEE